MNQFESFIRTVPDFPKPGIQFKDVTPLLADASAFRAVISQLVTVARALDTQAVAGIESRGFIFASAIAIEIGAAFVPIRKPGKLPAEKHRVSYELEYGNDSLEIHKDALKPGERTLIVDDLLATGGTAGAALELIRACGAVPAGAAFVIELGFLDGRSRLTAAGLDDRNIRALLRY